MDWATIAFNAFVTLGGLAGISTLFNLLLTRRKAKVESAEIEQNISDKVLQNVHADNAILRVEREQMQSELKEIRKEMDQTKFLLNSYRWDQYETRLLVIKLIQWSKKAHEEITVFNPTFEPPPTEDLWTKFSAPITNLPT